MENNDCKKNSPACAVPCAAEQHTTDLEPELVIVSRYLRGLEILKPNIEAQVAICRSAKIYVQCDDKLFFRTLNGPWLLIAGSSRIAMIDAYHDGVGLWNLSSTVKLAQAHFWGPRMGSKIVPVYWSCKERANTPIRLRYTETICLSP